MGYYVMMTKPLYTRIHVFSSQSQVRLGGVGIEMELGEKW